MTSYCKMSNLRLDISGICELDATLYAAGAIRIMLAGYGPI